MARRGAAREWIRLGFASGFRLDWCNIRPGEKSSALPLLSLTAAEQASGKASAARGAALLLLLPLFALLALQFCEAHFVLFNGKDI